jgi:uncharacterized protein YwqG
MQKVAARSCPDVKIAPMESVDELKRKLEQANLGHVADSIAKLARPCYRIKCVLRPEGEIPAGASKFGGSPDVPAEFVWPHNKSIKHSEPMEFVGQIRLEDLHEPLPEAMPRTGLLSFFTRWSDGCVYYYPQGTALQRTPGPNPPAPPPPSGIWQRVTGVLKRGPDVRQTYRACSLGFVHQISPPDGNSSMVGALKLSEEESETYFETYLESPAAVEHQMFGHSHPVQNEMELECDSLRRGEEMRWDLPQERFIAAARDWVLLLQVDTDESREGPGWMWGDAGMVYFWIHRDDLAAGAFDKVVATEQCH